MSDQQRYNAARQSSIERPNLGEALLSGGIPKIISGEPYAFSHALRSAEAVEAATRIPNQKLLGAIRISILANGADLNQVNLVLQSTAEGRAFYEDPKAGESDTARKLLPAGTVSCVPYGELDQLADLNFSGDRPSDDSEMNEWVKDHARQSAQATRDNIRNCARVVEPGAITAAHVVFVTTHTQDASGQRTDARIDLYNLSVTEQGMAAIIDRSGMTEILVPPL